MKDRDQQLLWEAYTTEKKHSKPDFLDLDGDGDTKEPMAKAAKEAKDKKPKKGGKKEMTDKQKKYFAKESGDYLEESSDQPGREAIHDAIRNLTGGEQDDGDWELAIKTACAGLAEYIIYHANPPQETSIVGSVIDDPDLADRWDFKTGVKDALQNLLDGELYGDLSKGFKLAFHKAQKDEQEGRFDNSPEKMLDRLRNNNPELGEPGIDDAPRSWPREREREGGNNLGL